jgi:hypothetical protein
MSKIDYKWHPEAPPAVDVYQTRRNESGYLTLRYWDGESWFSIAYSDSRGGSPFSWPKPTKMRRPSWIVSQGERIRIRRINTPINDIQWGEPFKVFDDKEVLAHLVKTHILPADWQAAYQEQMRSTS